MSSIRRFTAKFAVVTGAANGIGAETARRLHTEGCRLLLVDRDPAVVEVANDLDAGSLVLDIASPSAPDELASTVQHVGPLDVLVNNAGIGGSKPLLDTDEELLQRIVSINLLSVLRVTRALAPHFNKPARIVNVSSTLGMVGYPGTTAYAVAKAGIAQFTRQLAAEWGDRGISVNAVAPGVVETTMTDGHRANPIYLRNFIDPSPLGRAGQPSEIAAAIAFLASSDASFVNAEVLKCDGGWVEARSVRA